MSIRGYFIFAFLLLFFYPLQSDLYAQDSCESLELRLLEFKERKVKAENEIEKSKKGLMKAQEILLLARAKGDVLAGETVKEAIKYYEENISKNNLIIKKCDEEIIQIEHLLKLCRGDECNTIKSKIEKTRELLKQAIKDAENQSKEYEEFQREVKALQDMRDELVSASSLIDLALNIIGTTDPTSYTINLLNKLKNIIDNPTLTSIGLSTIQVGRDMKDIIDDINEKLEQGITSVDDLERKFAGDPSLVQKFKDTGLDIFELLDKLKKRFKKIKHSQSKIYKFMSKSKEINDRLKFGEYLYKSVHILVGYELLGEELSLKLYATDKTLEAIEALKGELKREMEICKKCVDLGRIKECKIGE